MIILKRHAWLRPSEGKVTEKYENKSSINEFNQMRNAALNKAPYQQPRASVSALDVMSQG